MIFKTIRLDLDLLKYILILEKITKVNFVILYSTRYAYFSLLVFCFEETISRVMHNYILIDMKKMATKNLISYMNFDKKLIHVTN